jgi:magnesium-transporting ATPase (P-type)
VFLSPFRLSLAIAAGLMFCLAFDDPMMSWVEGIVVLVIVIFLFLIDLISTFLKEVSRVKQEEQLLVFSSFRDNAILSVMRDGREESIGKDEIKVGDIVKIQSGMEIPADGILVKG